MPRDCVRLVKYDEYNQIIDRSYNPLDSRCISEIFGGVKVSYLFELLLEIKEPEDQWVDYKHGGEDMFVLLLSSASLLSSPHFSSLLTAPRFPSPPLSSASLPLASPHFSSVLPLLISSPFFALLTSTPCLPLPLLSPVHAPVSLFHH